MLALHFAEGKHAYVCVRRPIALGDRIRNIKEQIREAGDRSSPADYELLLDVVESFCRETYRRLSDELADAA